MGFIETLMLPVIKLKRDIGRAVLYSLAWDFNSSVTHPDLLMQVSSVVHTRRCSKLDEESCTSQRTAALSPSLRAPS